MQFCISNSIQTTVFLIALINSTGVSFHFSAFNFFFSHILAVAEKKRVCAVAAKSSRSWVHAYFFREHTSCLHKILLLKKEMY